MDDPNVYQQLGALQAKVEALEKQSATMDGKLDTLLARSERAKGAASMLWKVGAASSTGGGLLVAIATWWLDHFSSRGGQ